MAFRLHVWGQYACFRRPEFTQDFVTYDVMPPMAARSIFEAIHGPPSIQWSVETIKVLNPVSARWLGVREGVSGGTLSEMSRLPEPEPGLRNSFRRAHVLVDAAYVLSARFDLTVMAKPGETAAQHADTFRRRARQRRFFREPFLGLRELPANVEFLEKGMPDPSSRLSDRDAQADLGWMTYGTHTDDRPDIRFFGRCS